MRKVLLVLVLALTASTQVHATTYYLSAGGSDSNPGTSTGSPWLTPKHALNCGDVIIAAASTSYSGSNFTFGNWGAVTCAAGNNVAWLECATFDACKISDSSGNAMWIDQSYWGVQGWEVTETNTNACFTVAPNYTTPTEIHHIVLANDIANGCGSAGFGATNHNGSTTASVDYLAIIGTISYNAATSPDVDCGEGITIYQPILYDAAAGTHFFVAGNFAWGNVDNPACNSGAPTDGEGVILDTFNGSAGGITPYAGQSVVENNILLFNGGRGLQVLQNSAGTIYFLNNTVYGNNTDTHQGGFCGEILSNVNTGNTYVQHNIAATTASTNCNGSAWYAQIASGTTTAMQLTSGVAYSAAGNNCEAIGGSSFSCSGASFLTINPTFSSPSNPGAPSCASSSSVPNCMATVVSNFTPTNGSASGYGYQIPSNTPTFDPLFPQWLCNVNLPSGLVTMGCASSGRHGSSVGLGVPLP